MKVISSILLVMMLSCMTSCKTLLPGDEHRAISSWQSYQQAENTFNQIEAGVTTIADLQALGLNFRITPNLKKLTYLDLMARFNLDDSVFSDIKLPKGVQEALNKHHHCSGLELNLKSHHNRRVGTFWKDILGFQQITKTHGWEFTGLIVIVDGVAVYVLTSGSPKIENIRTDKKPLGPFQRISGGDIISIAEDL